MGTASKKFLAALDPQFVLFLEAGASGCEAIFKGLEKRNFQFLLSETALQEIQEMAEQGCHAAVRELAHKTLSKLRSHYGIKTPGLQNYEYGCAEVIADFLLEKCLPQGTTKNDAFLIAEASLHECDFLILLSPLTNVDPQRLNLLLADKDLNPISIACADDLIKVLL
ncbi:MAG TPA: hypothetical protein VMH87_07760 [Pseudomonadales bacterium]|nr:hypothetical protein [Pseudomonadales bacterium]